VGKTQEELDDELCTAAQYGNAPLCRELIAQGANVHRSTPDEAPIIHWPAFYGNDEVIKVLVDAGADVNAPSTGTEPGVGKRALGWAIIAKRPISTIELLLDAGADPNLTTGRYEWPLLNALAHGSYELVELLVARGAKSSFLPSGASKEERTAFQEAVARGCEKEIDLFVRVCGEDVDQVTLSGETMFELAKNDAKVREQLTALRSEAAIAAVLGDGLVVKGESTRPSTRSGAMTL
jgi:ankyrin repeat protein